jgi:glycosyltransferase involved in cell wall biosynthesis
VNQNKFVTLISSEIGNAGGIERVFLEFILYLSKHGYKINVICRSIDPSLLQHIQHFEKIDLPKGDSFLTQIFFQLLWIVKASMALKKLGKSAGVTIGPPCSAFRVDIAMAGSCHLASLLELQKEGKYRWLFNPMNWVIICCEHLLFTNSNTVVLAPSRRTSNEIHRLYKAPKERLIIIPHGVDLSLFKPAEPSTNKSNLRLEQNLPDNCLLLLTVTNELERKGCYEVLKALKILKQKGLNTHYVIAGRSEYDNYHQAINSMGLVGMVSCLPPRNNEKLAKLYQAADIFLLPTKYESFGLVGIEAMACGLPMISCKVGGIEDYLTDQQDGLLIERTPMAIADGVCTLSESDLRAQMSNNAIAKSQQYGWDNVLTPLKKLIDQFQSRNS